MNEAADNAVLNNYIDELMNKLFDFITQTISSADFCLLDVVIGFNT